MIPIFNQKLVIKILKLQTKICTFIKKYSLDKNVTFLSEICLLPVTTQWTGIENRDITIRTHTYVHATYSFRLPCKKKGAEEQRITIAQPSSYAYILSHFFFFFNSHDYRIKYTV